MGYTGDRPGVFFLLPIARDPDVDPEHRSLRAVCMPPHVFTEEPDGSLTIRESILALLDGNRRGWHGYLTKGVWTECSDSNHWKTGTTQP